MLNKRSKNDTPTNQPVPLSNETLGQYLRRLRLLRKMSLAEVCSQTPAEPESQHVSNSYLSQLEMGRAHHPSRERLISLAHVLDVPESWILEKAGYSGGTEPSEEEFDAAARNLVLRTSRLTPEDRSVLDAIIDGLLRRKQRD